jgi:hypothetical protein
LFKVYYKPVYFGTGAANKLYKHPIASHSLEIQKIGAHLFAKDIIAQKVEEELQGHRYWSFLITADNVEHALDLYPTVLRIAFKKGLL